MIKKIKGIGSIEYKIPNVADMMILLGRMGVDPDKIDDDSISENSELIYVGQMLKNMGPYVLKVDLKTSDDKEVKEYDESLNHLEFMPILSEVAGEIMQSLNVSAKKKPSSKK